MNKLEASELASNIGDIAADILIQLSQKKIKPSLIEQYFLGVLERERIILRDISEILKRNSENHITSAFVLFRVLLDDFIRFFSVYTSDNKEEEINIIYTDAYKKWFNNFQDMVNINSKLFNGQHPNIISQNELDLEKRNFRSKQENKKYFSDLLNFKFKKAKNISEVFENIDDKNKIKGNLDSYNIYRLLSNYVHFSQLTYNLTHDKETREIEINQIEHILIFCYKMLLMQFDFLQPKYQIVLNDCKVKGFVESKMT